MAPVQYSILIILFKSTVTEDRGISYLFKSKLLSQWSVVPSTSFPLANKLYDSIHLLIHELKEHISRHVKDFNSTKGRARSVLLHSSPNHHLLQAMEGLDSWAKSVSPSELPHPSMAPTSRSLSFFSAFMVEPTL